ncbi:MAG: molybdenum cofactor biosynthesis protein MoaE [Rhodobacteraceae bacterium]|nr:molybdenum cofactor biosynthesis protein MoaE [Paracoccaceae bacterium]
MAVRVQAKPFDTGAELAGFASGHKDVGAEVSFTGIVRDDTGGLRFMQIEHYPGMTEKAIAAIEAEAVTRWGLKDSLVIHRHGQLGPGEKIMMVATAAAHRAEAFAAAEFLMDYLKSRAPFWKKEVTADGEGWVAAKDEDEDALTRW